MIFEENSEKKTRLATNILPNHWSKPDKTAKEFHGIYWRNIQSTLNSELN